MSTAHLPTTPIATWYHAVAATNTVKPVAVAAIQKAKVVVLQHSNYTHGKIPCSRRRVTRGDAYFPTKAEAWAFLIGLAQKDVDVNYAKLRASELRLATTEARREANQ